MSTIQGSDLFQVEAGAVQYVDTIANIRAGTKSYDSLFVRRSGVDYKLPKSRRYDVSYTDSLLVNRSNVDYLVSGEDYLDYMWSYAVSSRKGVGATNSFAGSRMSAGDGHVAMGAFQYSGNAGRVYVWGLDGSTKYNKTGPSSSQFGYGVAAGDGRLVVGAFGARKAYIYDLPTGNSITTLSGPTNFGLQVAVGNGIIAVTEDGSTNGGSANGSCYVYDLNGNLQTRIFTPDAFGNSRIGGVYIGSGKLVIAMDTFGGSASNNGALHIYNASTLAYETTITGGANDRLGNISTFSVNQVSVDDDRIVAGTGNKRVRVYNLSGGLLKNITTPSGADNIGWGRICAVGCGRIFGVDPRNNFNGTKGVYIYDLDGNFLSSTTTGSNGNSISFSAVDSGLGSCIVTDVATGAQGGGFYTVGNTVA